LLSQEVENLIVADYSAGVFKKGYTSREPIPLTNKSVGWLPGGF